MALGPGGGGVITEKREGLGTLLFEMGLPEVGGGFAGWFHEEQLCTLNV